METANHSKQIDEATTKIQLFEEQPRFNRHLAYVLITELFWGKETLPGDSVPEQTINKYRKRLKKTLDTHSSKDMRALDRSWPRYARVNTLCNNQHRVSRQLREEGWVEVLYDKSEVNSQQFVDIVAGLTKEQYVSDYHIPNLLVFPPKTPLHEHDLVRDGSLMLQDKSSCFPVAALNPAPGSCVLDACAAPGMKTSQVAAAVCGGWVAVLGTSQPPAGARVIAVERNNKRFRVLQEMLSRSRASEVTTALNQDFLDIDPHQYDCVEYIMLDPSCSGTGMAKRGGSDEDPTPERLQKLSSFQFVLLKHALKFPNVKKVVYSTCAVSEEENEKVIQKITDEHPNWRVIQAMPSWERRGHEAFTDGDKFVRADPDKDLCNGFFVAVLERNLELKVENGVGEEQEESSVKSKKKKKKKDNDRENNDESKVPEIPKEEVEEENIDVKSVKEKKKKKKRDRETEDNQTVQDQNPVKKKKKKKDKD